jgi:hypothetical protein
MYQQALPLYVAAGWRGVLPVPSGTKGPPPDGFTGWTGAEPGREQLDRWAAEHPDWNLALRMPDGVLGIDVDAYGDKPGAATLASLEAELGPLPATWVSSARPAPSGIRLFRVPPGRAWRQPGPGIDLIHFGHRYAVVWPSVHPEGWPYQWIITDDPTPGGIPQLAELPELPPAWVARLDAGQPRIVEQADLADGQAGQWLEQVAWPRDPAELGWGPCPVMTDSATRHAHNIAAGIPNRHDAMRDGVAAVVKLAADGHRGVVPALEALRLMFHTVTTDRDTHGEWGRALGGAVRKDERVSLLYAPPCCRCGVPRDPAPATTPVEHGTMFWPITELDSIVRPPPVIDGVLDGGTLFAVTGRDGVYKSFLVFDWLGCIATGKDWLGRQVPEPGPVLYVVGEGVFGLTARRNAWQQTWGRRIAGETFTVRVAPVNLFRPRNGDVADLAKRIAGYRVVIFDTLQRMSSGADLDKSRDASLVIEQLDQLRRLTGGSIGFVAHTGKGDVDARGSSVLEDDVDVVWRMRRPEDAGYVEATLAKRKDGPAEREYYFVPQPVRGTGSIVLRALPRNEARRHGDDAATLGRAMGMLEVLGARFAEDGLSRTHLEQELRTRGGSKGHGSFGRAADKLLELGLISKRKNGPYVLYSVTQLGRARLAEVSAGTSVTRPQISAD